MALHRIADAGSRAASAMPPAMSLCLTKSMALREFGQPRLDRRAQLLAVLDLDRIVAGQLGRACRRREGCAATACSCSARNCGVGGQEIAARGALGAADFQQQGGDLVFDLDGMHHPAAVLAGLVDEDDRGGADRDQHQKSRRKQQDLPNRAPARGIERHQWLAWRNRRSPAGGFPATLKTPVRANGSRASQLISG